MTPSSPGAIAAAPAPRGELLPHIPALDGVRGLAICLVILRHLSLLPILAQSDNALDRTINSVARVGWVGVDLFFVLSGFLITGILLREGERSATLGAKFGRFYWRRVLRILPLYYAAVAVLVFVVPYLPYYGALPQVAIVHRYQWFYWLHGVNLLGIMHGNDAVTLNTSHFWSLAVEEQFYLVWPVVVMGLSRRTLWKVVGAILVLDPLLRLGFILGLPDGFLAAIELSPARMDVLAVGALLALVSQSDVARRRAAPLVKPIGLGALVVLLILALTRGLDFSHNSYLIVIGFSAIALSMGALLAHVLGLAGPGNFARPFAAAVPRSFGKYAYCLYIVHYPLMDPLERLWTRVHIGPLLGSHLPEWLAFATCLVGLSYLIAMVSWRLLEAPMLSLKEWGPFGTPHPAAVLIREPSTPSGA